MPRRLKMCFKTLRFLLDMSNNYCIAYENLTKRIKCSSYNSFSGEWLGLLFLPSSVSAWPAGLYARLWYKRWSMFSFYVHWKFSNLEKFSKKMWNENGFHVFFNQFQDFININYQSCEEWVIITIIFPAYETVIYLYREANMSRLTLTTTSA